MTIIDKLVNYWYGDMNAQQIFSRKRFFESDAGHFRLSMNILEITECETKGLFLNRFKLSWIFFDIEKPLRRVLVDSHAPFGLHVHLDNGERLALNAENLEEAIDLFKEIIERRFGLRVEI